MPKKKIEYISKLALCPACGGEKQGFYNVCTTCKGQGVLRVDIPKEKTNGKTKTTTKNRRN